MVDAVLEGLMTTNHSSVCIRHVLERRKLKTLTSQIEAVERILTTKSLVEQQGRNSKKEALFSLSETGGHFIKTFGNYSNYLERIENEILVKEQKTKTPPINFSDTAEHNQTALRENGEAAVDLVLHTLESTTQPSLSIKRILKKAKIIHTDELITAIENILNAKSLVNNMGKSQGSNTLYALSETGQDFITTFGSYSKFLKGVKKENRKAKRVKNKKPYKASPRLDGEPISVYSPPEKNTRYVAIRLVFLFVIAILAFLVFKLT